MFFQIDFGNGLAIYDQVVRQVKFAVAGEVLKEGELVPSVRELARELTINPNTVARAYRQLQDDGVLTSVRGTGLAVAAGRRPALPGRAGGADPRAAGTGLRRGQAESARSAQAAGVGGTAVGLARGTSPLSPGRGLGEALTTYTLTPAPLPKRGENDKEKRSCPRSSGSTN